MFIIGTICQAAANRDVACIYGTLTSCGWKSLTPSSDDIYQLADLSVA